MENLTNEQIVDIINFYKLCGITEDMYLSSDKVIDLFTLLGIKPEYDENGDRKLTVYEQLEIAPKFKDGKEVPIVFSIKHKVTKVAKNANSDIGQKFTYLGKSKNAKDKSILNKLKQDYFSAISNGNLNEATRLYDVIDLMTGGKADYFIAVQYNCVKFYKKMQKQLLIDMFANFVILMVLSQKQTIKNGVVKFDKLYKSFVEKQLSYGGFAGTNITVPKLSNVTVSVNTNGEDQKLTIKTSASKKGVKLEEKTVEQIKLPDVEEKEIGSFIKSKINIKLNHLREKLTRRLEQTQVEKQENELEKSKELEKIEEKKQESNFVKSNFNKQEKFFSVLEND